MPRAPKPKSPKPTPVFDLALVPGSPAEQRRAADKMLQRGEAPLEVRKAGATYELVVLGTPIGRMADKQAVCNAAFTVGQYRLELGSFASTYIKGWCKR